MVHKEGISLTELTKLVDGTLYGDGSFRINTIRPLDEPLPDSIHFAKELNTARLKKLLNNTTAKALILSDTVEISIFPKDLNIVLVKDPYGAIRKLLPLFFPVINPTPSIDARAAVSSSAKIGKDVWIGPFASIGDHAEIGDNCIIHPFVCIYPHAKVGPRATLHSHCAIREFCEVGSDCVIQNGSVVGGDGFGYVPDPEVGLRAIPQVGIVRVGDRVDIGANACIDRATLGTTVIGMGTKIDNLVQVGHNTKIGEHCILCGQVGIAGSCKIGNRVVLGGNAGVGDHVTVADDVRFGAKAATTLDVLEVGDYSGYPALPAKTWLKNAALLKDLPKLAVQLRRLLKDKND